MIVAKFTPTPFFLKATQKNIAVRLGITQPQVSDLKHDKFDRFSSDRLIALLGNLGGDGVTRDDGTAAAGGTVHGESGMGII